jgi:peptidoglycan hydrolase CwlO-like protein
VRAKEMSEQLPEVVNGFALSAFLVSVIIIVILTIVGVRYYKKYATETSEKIDDLANVLKKASSEIITLEQEVSAKSKKLQELNQHSKQLEDLLSLKQEQVEAIKAQLKTTLTENTRKNRIWTIVIGAIWFVLGVIVRSIFRF